MPPQLHAAHMVVSGGVRGVGLVRTGQNPRLLIVACGICTGIS